MTIDVGTVVKINGSIGTILKIQDGLALIKWDSGGQTCYGVNGIRASQIIKNSATTNNFQMTQTKLYYSVKNKDMWGTPDEIFLPLNAEFNFTLDPCCTIGTAKCPMFFTPDEDGLKQDWSGHRVFVNPPYSRGNIDKWMQKCVEESKKENTIVVALIPASTSSEWFHEYIIGNAEIRFVKGRINFVGAIYNAPFSSIIAVFGGMNKILDEEVKKEIYEAATEYAKNQPDQTNVSKHHFISGAIYVLGNTLVQGFIDQSLKASPVPKK